MLRSRGRRLAVVAVSTLMIAGLLGSGAEAGPPPPGKVSFSTPGLFPSFAPQIQDYVVRCHDAPVTVQVHTAPSWEAAINDHAFRSGDFSEVVPLAAGRAFVITVREVGQPQLHHYHVRCLPDDFPAYTFTRYGPVSPKYFAADNGDADRRYGIIFDDRGVPLWFYKARAHNPRVLVSGNVLWANVITDRYEVHRLDGSLFRTLGAVGQPANDHDFQFASNGHHLVGAYVTQRHVDTSAYGGSSDADVINTELQQVGGNGDLIWSWKSQDHISLDETPAHRWRWAINNPTPQGYDILHWNSIEPAGDSVIASFRHLDAVYKIRKSSGKVVWKLGGTQRPRSLTVRNDPLAYTFGAQHDARLLPDGTLTVFDNRSNVSPARPRAVRYRINEQGRTATLLQSITDPEIHASYCCGSARRLPNGHWLIGWGKTGSKTGPIVGYTPNGQRTFRLTFSSRWSYRAEPVPAGAISAQDLRQGMNAIYGAP